MVEKKLICFRTKGNHKQGMGDVISSLSIAEEFRLKGHLLSFIIDNDSEAITLIKKFGYNFIVVKNNEGKIWRKKYFDMVIANQLTSPYEQLFLIRQHCRKLVTIDDTGPVSRKLADLRINPLYYVEDAHCNIKYIPLNRVFQKTHKQKKIVKDNVEHILISMGGSDTYGFTPQILKILSDYSGDDTKISVIIGQAFKHNYELKRVITSSKRKFNIFRSIESETMRRLISSADLAICAGGNTLFEMACCGTPAIIICGEPFEKETAYRMRDMGFGKVIGFNKRLSSRKLTVLLNLMRDRRIRAAQSRIGRKLIDGKGAGRIVKMALSQG